MARHSFVPTDELRAKVRHLSGVGVPHDDIAKIVDCSPKTLRKHFRRELDLGAAEANAMAGGYLFQNVKAGNVAAQIFWMKSRARWRERHDERDADGSAAAPDNDADKLVLERMAARFERLNKKANDDDEENET